MLPGLVQKLPHGREKRRIDAVAAAELETFHPDPGILQQLLHPVAMADGHHGVVNAMGEQHRRGPGMGLPVTVGVTAAGDQSRQRQWRLCTGDHIQGHGSPLREAQKRRAGQRDRGIQGQEALPQGLPGRRHLLPGRLRKHVPPEQRVPLAAGSGGMGLRGTQGDHADLGRHQKLRQIKQVIGIGAPAMQQDQPAQGQIRPQADGLTIVTGLGRRLEVGHRRGGGRQLGGPHHTAG